MRFRYVIEWFTPGLTFTVDQLGSNVFPKQMIPQLTMFGDDTVWTVVDSLRINRPVGFDHLIVLGCHYEGRTRIFCYFVTRLSGKEYVRGFLGTRGARVIREDFEADPSLWVDQSVTSEVFEKQLLFPFVGNDLYACPTMCKVRQFAKEGEC